MKAATTEGFLFHSKLTTTETDTPSLAEHDVLVEVHASSVNPKDWKLNQVFSSLIPNTRFFKKPLLIGDDLAGIVVEKGSAVHNFEIGDAVFGMDMHPRTAACAEFARIDAHCIARKPNNLSFSEAAACPLAGLTALQGLRLGQVKTGSKVLIIGASGGVGTFAVQLAKAMGAQVTGVCSGKNIALVRKLGADQVIDYQQEDITQRQDNFDLVFDVTSHQSLASCTHLLRSGGIFVSTGGNAHAIVSTLRDRMLHRRQHAQGVWVSPNTADLNALANFIEQGTVVPVIDSQFPLHQVNTAYQRNRTGHCVGKVVIAVK